MSVTLEKIESGARNLLLNCAGAQVDDKILLVGEKGDNLYFDPQLCDDVAQVANSLGMSPKIVLAEPVADAEHFPKAVRDAMETADRTIFFSRLGDQIRFATDPNKAKSVMTYALTREHLAAPFSSVDFNLMKRMHGALLSLIVSANEYSIKTHAGTDLTSKVIKAKGQAVTEFALELFPVMIFPPVNCHEMQGTLMIDHFVTSSSTRAYEDSSLVLDASICATVENSHMVSFSGPPNLVNKLEAQLKRAASITGGDPYKINSWHTGINPNTFFMGDPYEDLERWGTVAYGSPRYTHMHAAGIDPGDLAFHIMDATITFDNQILWDEGRFVFLDRPEVQALMNPEQQALLNSSVLNSIGL